MATTYRIGTSGWNYDHWKGPFYPDDLSKNRWFDHYKDAFDSVEVNYSFYRWPKEKTLEGWKEKAPTGFRYTLKAPRTITHVKRLHEVAGKIDDFYALSSVLGAHMGCHLFQLPPSYGYTDENLARLASFLGHLDGRKDNAVEFRDPAWWRDDVYDLLKKNKTAFVTVAGLSMPDELVTTHRIGYFRFHGDHYDTRYSETDIKGYAKAIEDQDCDTVYAYFNNDANGYAPENAKMLAEALT